jgi:hypothetical protein
VLETIAFTVGPALFVALLFGGWWLARHRPPRAATRAAVPVKLDRAAAARLAEERRVSALVEDFEKLVAAASNSRQSAEILMRLTGLSDEAKSRLSAGCAHAIGSALAEVNRGEEALFWLDQANERNDQYFRTLRAAIVRPIAGTTDGFPDLPKYPFSHVQLPELATRTMLKARLLHGLRRHTEVESLLGPFVRSPDMRYLRADLRRQRGDTSGALADFRAVAAVSRDFKRVQHWITELSPPEATPPQVEPLWRRAGSDAEVSPPRTSVPPRSAPPRSVPPRSVPPPSVSPPSVPPRSAPPRSAPPRSVPPPSVPPSRPSQGKTPWEVLGVPQAATPAQIQSAYLELSRKYHPDRANSLGEEHRLSAEKEMREINRAWLQLSRRKTAS